MTAPFFAHAFMEVGVSGSYRRSNLDEDNFTESKTITGSFSYYFASLSAIELSYTKGLNTVQAGDISQATGQITKTEYQLIGLDFILSMGKESAIRPYIKLGAVHVDSKIVIQNDFDADVIEPESGIAPSAGLGVKLLFGKQFSVRLGVDGWTSPLSQDPVVYNYAGKVGISWIF